MVDVKSSLRPTLVNGPFQDPALYVALRWQGDALLFDLGRIDRSCHEGSPFGMPPQPQRRPRLESPA